MSFIYVITNDINGKQYVGKTNNTIEKRFREHILDSKKVRCEKRPLYSAMRKYGIEHFYIKTLEECSVEESSEKEKYWIARLNTYGHNGYNATRGGDSRKYYDYEEIVRKYLQLRCKSATAAFFKCDVYVVNQACKEYKIKNLNDINKPKGVGCYQNGQLIRQFDSCMEAARWLVDNNYTTSIRSATNVGRVASKKYKYKTAYGFEWSFLPQTENPLQ